MDVDGRMLAVLVKSRRGFAIHSIEFTIIHQ